MAFTRPTLTEIDQRIAADLSGRMIGVEGAVLRRSVLGVLARAEAGVSHELHGYLDWISRQVIIDTADAENLLRWTQIWGIQRRGAEFASGEVRFTGNDGAVVPAGALLQRPDGAEFETLADALIVAGVALAPVRALQAGADSNTAAGISLTLQRPVSGVASVALITAGGIVNGSDPESDAQLRERLLARLRNPPHGGAKGDYEAWALEVPGVTRAWVLPAWMGLGTVGVIFVRDGDPSNIPDAIEVAAVAAHIEERRPVTAEVFVLAPRAVPIDIEIRIRPNTAAVREAVSAELRDLLTREAAPGGTLLRSRIGEAIATAPGEQDHVVDAPADNITFGPVDIGVLGTLTFNDLP
ncbi:baseplate J/gp47 family protein [Lysobacter sp. LF1]|uniref:Baseplate J/gp47 family protein n=1 Tax=Lysobacter stagni TaxID=3045172 RepID=A0ABT6XKN4_9GAMM|nr:baseplate J/gp47 family protein [Lysobacter sp. LF1]MDI9240730.1 baseplate J/gp47 family protein [Lysobacter sp. LF1]